MGSKFVISHLDQQLGPFSEEELRARWLNGELLPIDYVYDEGKQDWLLIPDRFAWAATATQNVTPPPIKEMKKRRPPAPKVEIAGSSLLKEWKKAEGNQGAKAKIVDGVGEFDLSPLSPGQVELVLQDASSSFVKMQEPLKIHVRSPEPEEIVWTIAAQQTVGQDVEVALKAVDANGTVCGHFNAELTIDIQAEAGREQRVRLQNGVAAIRFHHTKTETWKLTLNHSGEKKLRLPRPHSLSWLPGPAVRLVLDGPPSLVAGQPLKVQVKAVDAYGNLAKTFQGTVILEVKAS